MARQLVEIRILPPFVIGRLGSSPSPMDNYKLEITEPVGARAIVAAPTLVVDTITGEATLATPPAPVRFRDEQGRIRPIAPFLEVWARFDDSDNLVPLTIQNLAEAGINPNLVQWSVHVANHKAFRRTRDPNDRIEATLGPFSDHDRRALEGISCNFKTDKVLPLGHAQYIRPTNAVPGIPCASRRPRARSTAPTGTPTLPTTSTTRRAAPGKATRTTTAIRASRSRRDLRCGARRVYIARLPRRRV